MPGSSRITPGEVFLVLGLLALVGVVVGVEGVKEHFPDWVSGDTTAVDLDVAPKAVPANARVTIRGMRGDISVRSSNEAGDSRQRQEERAHVGISATPIASPSKMMSKSCRTATAGKCSPTKAAIRASAWTWTWSCRAKSAVTVRNDKGDISVADMGTSVTINSGSGDIDVRNTNGDVNLDMKRGDAKITGTKGDVKISGTGDSVDVVDADRKFHDQRRICRADSRREDRQGRAICFAIAPI